MNVCLCVCQALATLFPLVQILASAFALHSRSPHMCYTTAAHEALHGNTEGALQCLMSLVEQCLEQPCSEAVQPHTAALIYRYIRTYVHNMYSLSIHVCMHSCGFLCSIALCAISTQYAYFAVRVVYVFH